MTRNFDFDTIEVSKIPFFSSFNLKNGSDSNFAMIDGYLKPLISFNMTLAVLRCLSIVINFDGVAFFLAVSKAFLKWV